MTTASLANNSPPSSQLSHLTGKQPCHCECDNEVDSSTGCSGLLVQALDVSWVNNGHGTDQALDGNVNKESGSTHSRLSLIHI